MKTKIFDCDVLALNRVETLNYIDSLLKSNQTQIQHVVLNASKTVLINNDHHLKKIVQSCDVINADGQSIVWASKLFGKKLPERVTGIDLMNDLIELSSKEGYSVYFLGATQDVVDYVTIYFSDKYPNLKIVGSHHGYFLTNKTLEQEVINDIRNKKPDLLFVAFSSPQKEIWLNRWKEHIGYKFAMGVGGSFDIIAGKYRRAPKWMQSWGLEWFYRFLQEPNRMFKRYFFGNLAFLRIMILDYLKIRFSKRENGKV